MSAQPSRKRGKSGEDRGSESGQKKPRIAPISKLFPSQELMKLGEARAAALRERVPKQRYDAALAARLFVLAAP